MKFQLNKIILPVEIASERLGVAFEKLEKIPVAGGFLKFLLMMVVVAFVGLLLLLGMSGFVFFAFFLNDLAQGG